MSGARRIVRATASFFQDLDRQLGPERGANGEPSSNDFQVFDLLRVVDRFATAFDDLPELIPGRPDYRILISMGMLVPRFAVVGQLAPDGAVELVQLDLDLEQGPHRITGARCSPDLVSVGRPGPVEL